MHVGSYMAHACTRHVHVHQTDVHVHTYILTVQFLFCGVHLMFVTFGLSLEACQRSHKLPEVDGLHSYAGISSNVESLHSYYSSVYIGDLTRQ